MINKIRHDGRSYNQLRPITLHYNSFGYAAGSVLFEMGNTKVLCAVTLQNGVPPFLRGKQVGWLSAEYAMLPTATMERSAREISQLRRNGRASEISRLISRTLRIAVNLETIGERTITIDCDVLQADGGTRVACITGAYYALKKAEESWLQAKLLTTPIIVDELAAISVGVLDNEVILDPDFTEDSMLNADCNFVLTRSNKIVEIQTSAEKSPIAWEQYNKLIQVAREGVAQLFEICSAQNDTGLAEQLAHQAKNKQQPTPFFSLLNRQKNT
jgi:ribonuclease PH